MRHPETVAEVVEAGLCIGCGLCAALAPGGFRMAWTAEGRLRPARIGPADEAAILAACPGAVSRPHDEATPENDDIWGGYHRMQRAWAGDPEIRFRAATGGVLTALGAHLVRTGAAAFILHCEADPDRPMRSRWCLSDTPEAVIRRAGSRYGPTDTLAGLGAAVARGQPFAVIAKPCDAGAVRERAKADPALAKNLVALLVMVCGGASDLGKSRQMLDAFGVAEDELALLRYRGFGNPGRTRIETRDGRAFEMSYNEAWADETGWRIQTRCKICPDALGEAADIAAADLWPGGVPAGEDAGFNGVITRTSRGEALFRSALAAGALQADAGIDPRTLDDCQPHQVRKKRALAARLRGMAAAGSPVYQHQGLRIDRLDAKDMAEEDGARARVLSGRLRETMPQGDADG
ncbi:MAG: coenzyme F420 hydrogenase [Alphaproteobacteria bacterium]|nr:MAG: coenzyme F420 hydrogenase [Alphaproteobacteria bacterium]